MTDEIDKLKKFLQQRSDLKLAIVFGSFADGSARESSDIDLAIAFSQRLSLDQLSEFSKDASLVTDREVDVIDLHNCHGEILVQILTKGLRLVEHDSGFRNILVRDYTSVDWTMVWSIIDKHLSDFSAFAQQVIDYQTTNSL